MNICKHATSTAQFPFLYSPVGKNSWFNVLKHILKQVTSTLQTMKQWNLIFLLFSQNGNLSIHFQPYSRWEEGRSAKRFPASFPQYFWLRYTGIWQIYKRDSGNWKYRTPPQPPAPGMFVGSCSSNSKIIVLGVNSTPIRIANVKKPSKYRKTEKICI